jgi:RHS repeat-associated protein
MRTQDMLIRLLMAIFFLAPQAQAQVAPAMCVYGFEVLQINNIQGYGTYVSRMRSGTWTNEDGSAFGAGPTSFGSAHAPIRIEASRSTPFFVKFQPAVWGYRGVVPEAISLTGGGVIGSGRESINSPGFSFGTTAEEYYANCKSPYDRDQCRLSWDYGRGGSSTTNAFYNATDLEILTDLWLVRSDSAQCWVPPARRHQPEPLGEASDPACPVNAATKGNPVSIRDQRKLETLGCLKLDTPGYPIRFSMQYNSPRVMTTPTTQSRLPRWTHSYDRRLFKWTSAPQCSGATCNLGTDYRRIQLENGEAYDFVGTQATQQWFAQGGTRAGKLNFANGEYQFVYPNGDVDHFSDSSGLLLRSVRRNGSSLTFDRSESNVLKIINAPSGRGLRVALSGGRPTSVREIAPVDGTTLSASMSYDGSGNLIQFTDPANRTRNFTYNLGRLATQTNFLGAQTQISYQSNDVNNVGFDKVASEILGNGNRLDFINVAGQPWDLIIRETGVNGTQRDYRFQRNAYQQITRAYLGNSTSAFNAFEYNSSGQLLKETDAAGRVTEYSYGNGFMVNKRAYRDATNSDLTVMVNDEFGQPTKITDAAGGVMEYAFDSARGWLTSIKRTGAGLTQTTNIEYSPVSINGVAASIGLPTGVVLPDGTRNTQSYDSFGFPAVSTVDAGRLNLTSSTQYNARGYLMAATDARGVRTNYEYSNNPASGQFGNLGLPSAQVYDATGRAVRSEYRYDAMLNPLNTITDAGSGRINASNSVSYQMVGSDALYAPTQFSDAENRQSTLSYDAFGQIVSMTQVGANAGGANRVTTLQYTPEGFLSAVVRQSESQPFQRYEYDASGLIKASIDARGVRTNLYRDGKARVIRTCVGSESVCASAGQGREMRYSYDALDRVVKTEVSLGGGAWRTAAEASFDSLGRLIFSKDGAGNATTYNYSNTRNWLLNSLSGSGADSIATAYNYDALGRLLNQTTDPNGKKLTTTLTYATTGDRLLPQSVTNPRGMSTRYRYNSFGLIDKLIDALGNEWNYTTNNLAHLIRIDVPGIGADTIYTVNKLGETLALSRDGKTESWQYNTDGNIRSRTDFSGQQVMNNYDAIGRLISVDYAGTNSDPNGSRSDASMTYLPNDLIASITSKPNGVTDETTSYAYDGGNRLTATTRNGRQVSYGYNLDDTLSQMGYWTRGTVNFGYNSASGSLVRSLTAFGQGSTYNYGTTNLLRTITRPGGNGVSSNFGYDSALRLSSITHSKAGVNQYAANYLLDPNGNRTQLTESFGANNALAANTTVITRMGYDPLDRLTHADHGAIGSAAMKEENYVYDAVGNRNNVQTTVKYNSNDFNRDGSPDFFWHLQDATGTTVSWTMTGANSSQIARGAVLTPVANVWNATSGDINGDGVSELLWRNTTGANVFWKLGGADGTTYVSGDILRTETGADSAFNDPNWVQEAVADINRDGKGDIIWRNYAVGAVTIWYMGGDTNGNRIIGRADLTGITAPTDTQWHIEGAGDFNNDGFVDLLWHHQTIGAVVIWYLGGDGTRYIGGTQPELNGVIANTDATWRLRGVADANKDGTPDIYWHNRNDGSVVIWNLTDSGKTIQSGITLADKPALPWSSVKGTHYNRVISDNKLVFDSSDRITSAGFSYDGNDSLLTTSDGTSYTYTAAKKLLRTTKNGVTTEYQYDGSGNLVRQIRAGVSTDYVLNELAAHTQVIGEISGSNQTAFVYGPDGLHAQQRWINDASQGLEYSLNDGLGSVKALSNASGSLIKTNAFDVWGQPRFSSSGASSNLGFTGEQQMSDGTVNLRARSYVPAIGRFLQRDSFAGFSNRPQSLNRFAYVEGNPGNMVDPSGNVAIVPVVVGGLAIWGVYETAATESKLRRMSEISKQYEDCGLMSPFNGQAPLDGIGNGLIDSAAGAAGGRLATKIPTPRFGRATVNTPPPRGWITNSDGPNIPRYEVNQNGGLTASWPLPVDATEVRRVTESLQNLGKKTTIGSATHGTPQGDMVDAIGIVGRNHPKYKTDGDLFFDQDLTTATDLNSKIGANIGVTDMRKPGAGQELFDQLNHSSDITICAWCYSSTTIDAGKLR